MFALGKIITPIGCRFILVALALLPVGAFADVQLDKIKLPGGFHITLYAQGVPGARSMALSPNGTLFIGTRQQGRVYAVVDADGDAVADTVHEIASGLNMPNGVAFRKGALYVAEINRILRYDDIETKLENPPEPVVLNDSYPAEGFHGWKFIRFSPDDKLYVPVGAPCNICLPEGDERYATMTRMNADGTNVEIFARGIRNTVGFDWHPETHELWFTDNGLDLLGDDIPPDELNHAPRAGLHFGFPYVHGKDLIDQQFGQGHTPSEFALPARELGPHSAALGMRFYTGAQFPAEYKNQIFIAEHGSWNRSPEAGHTGYRISVVRLENNRAKSYEIFAYGWLRNNEAWGRPVDLQEMADGSLLVSDDHAGVVYRISYSGN